MSTLNQTKTKIQIEFDAKQLVIESELYRPLSFIKDKALKYFLPKPQENYVLLYNNKDLTAFDSVSLGDYFKFKAFLSLS